MNFCPLAFIDSIWLFLMRHIEMSHFTNRWPIELDRVSLVLNFVFEKLRNPVLDCSALWAVKKEVIYLWIIVECCIRQILVITHPRVTTTTVTSIVSFHNFRNHLWLLAQEIERKLWAHIPWTIHTISLIKTNTAVDLVESILESLAKFEDRFVLWICTIKCNSFCCRLTF